MVTSLTHISLLVKDYDEALSWYTDKLGLELRNNEEMVEYGAGYRWVTVGVKGQQGLEIVLHKSEVFQPMDDDAPSMIFSTDDCRSEVERLRANGVKITEEVQEVPWGLQALIEDLYGNTLVLVEPPKKSN